MPAGPQQLSCLHISASLAEKNWEKRNLKVFPPQLSEEPRRPAVSLNIHGFKLADKLQIQFKSLCITRMVIYFN